MNMGMVQLDITSFISGGEKILGPTTGLQLATTTKVSLHSTCQVNHLDTSLIFVDLVHDILYLDRQ